MPDYATAQGNIDDQQPHPLLYSDNAEHWLSDPGQLIHWQGQLVNYCNAINSQLTQIREELKVESDQSLRVICHPAMIAGD